MSRRCRLSLIERTPTGDTDGLDSGNDCVRIGNIFDPCEEPLVYGTNILVDGSLERHLGVTGAGPNGDEIPYTKSGGGLFWPSDDSRVASNFPSSGYNGTGWCHYPGVTAGVPFWTLSTANPRTGTYHMRFLTPTPGGAVRDLRAVTFLDCDGDLSTDNWPLTGRAVPGDLVVWSLYLMDGNASSGVFELQIRFFQNIPGLVSTGTAEKTFTAQGSYTKHQVASFVPANTYYFAAETDQAGFGDGNTVDLDDAQVQVVPLDQTIILCAFSSLITVDNDTTETDFL